MTAKKTGDPKDAPNAASGARFVPVTGTYGTEVIVPGPLTAGRPKPEPEERWTLGPGRHPEPDDEPGSEAPALPSEPLEPRTPRRPG
jgi:hypothetical protein